MLIRKSLHRPNDLPERIYVINAKTLDNLEKISERSGIPEHIIMTACENTGLFFWQKSEKPRRRTLNRFISKQKQKKEATQTGEYIGEMARELRLMPSTLFSICDNTGLFPIKAPTKVVSVHGVDYA